MRQAPDPVIEAVVATLQAQDAAVRVPVLADRLGLSQRQLLHRCTEALGYGPKMLARILRFQRFRALAAGRLDLSSAHVVYP